MAEDTKDDKDQTKRPKLKVPWADTSIAEEGAKSIEKSKKRSSLDAIDELISG